MTCNFLFVNGAKIGTYCGEQACLVQGNTRRCADCVNTTWPKEIYQCRRILTKGNRAGLPCGKNTRFADLKCATCRRCVEVLSPPTPDLIQPEETIAPVMTNVVSDEEFESLWRAFIPPVEDPESTDKYDQLPRFDARFPVFAY